MHNDVACLVSFLFRVTTTFLNFFSYLGTSCGMTKPVWEDSVMFYMYWNLTFLASPVHAEHDTSKWSSLEGRAYQRKEG